MKFDITVNPFIVGTISQLRFDAYQTAFNAVSKEADETENTTVRLQLRMIGVSICNQAEQLTKIVRLQIDKITW